MIRRIFDVVNIVPAVFMVMGLAATVWMFVLDWKMSLCIVGLMWADRALRSM